MLKLNTKYKVLTPNGYEPFYGINKIQKPCYLHLTFSNGKELKCSEDHPLMTIEGKIRAKYLNKTTEIITKSGCCFLLSKRKINKPIELFDIINSGINHTYFTNDLLSHNCQFLGSSNTLISSIKLQQLRYEDPTIKRGPPDNCVDIYHEVIKETIDDDTGEIKDIDHKYVIVVDPAEGKHLDYSAFSVLDVTKIPYLQVAKYHSNLIAPILFPSIIYETARYYNDSMVLIEIQSVGLQIADILHFDLEYDGIYRVSSGNKKSQQISAGHLKNSAPGVKTTAAVKKIGCSNLKTLVETDQLILKDFDTIQELTTFVYNTKGTYSADTDQDNDDLAMTLVLFSWLTTQKHFKESVTHNLRKELQRSVLDYEDETMLPSLVIDDGIVPTLEKWGGIFWSDMTAECSYTNPYGDFFKTWSPKRRDGYGLDYETL